MTLPFTPDQFFGIFAEYNRAFWPIVVVWWFVTLTALGLVWRQPEQWSRALSLLLGSLWLWNAGAYHAFLFARINPAAWIFATLFAVQALLFLRAAMQRPPIYASSSGVRQGVGVLLAAYSLAYPILTMAMGHDYPATPTFALPCPTVILTIGLLLTLRGRLPWSLTLIPMVWGFIGGSAAVLLQVQSDYVLLAGGALLLAVVIAQSIRRGP